MVRMNSEKRGKPEHAVLLGHREHVENRGGQAREGEPDGFVLLGDDLLLDAQEGRARGARVRRLQGVEEAPFLVDGEPELRRCPSFHVGRADEAAPSEHQLVREQVQRLAMQPADAAEALPGPAHRGGKGNAQRVTRPGLDAPNVVEKGGLPLDAVLSRCEADDHGEPAAIGLHGLAVEPGTGQRPRRAFQHVRADLVRKVAGRGRADRAVDAARNDMVETARGQAETQLGELPVHVVRWRGAVEQVPQEIGAECLEVVVLESPQDLDHARGLRKGVREKPHLVLGTGDRFGGIDHPPHVAHQCPDGQVEHPGKDEGQEETGEQERGADGEDERPLGHQWASERGVGGELDETPPGGRRGDPGHH